jgi:AcrR family transcriptional regulator
MLVKNCQAKKLIIESAMKLSFPERRIYTTIQNLAYEAGVNRTFIKYYFQSKKALLVITTKTTRKVFFRNSDMILLSNLAFKKKTERFSDDFINNLPEYPYLESFVTTDLIQSRLMKNTPVESIEIQRTPIKQINEEISEEMEVANIPENNPVHFTMNFFPLMIYQIIIELLRFRILNLIDNEYQIISYERKKVNPELLFSSEDAKQKFKNQN